MLPLASSLSCGHSSSNGYGGVQPAVRVTIRNADLLGTALGIASQRRQAGQGHDGRTIAHIVFLWSCMSIAGN